MSKKKTKKEQEEQDLFMENVALAETTIDHEKIQLLITQEDKYIKNNISRVKDNHKPKETLTEYLLNNKKLTEDQLGHLFEMLYQNWKDANKSFNTYRHNILKKIANIYIQLLKRNDEVIKPITKIEKQEYDDAQRERKALLGYIEELLPEVSSSEAVRAFKRKK